MAESMAEPAPVWVDIAERLAGRGDEVLALSASAFAVLAVFAEVGGRVVGRTELSRRAGLAQLSERRADALIVELRRVLGADAIVTVRGRGWRCETPLHLVATTASA